MADSTRAMRKHVVDRDILPVFRSRLLNEITVDEPLAPVEAVAVPEVLPMPAQLKLLPEAGDAKSTPEPTDERVRVSRANAEARVAPAREGYVNAIQVWPFTDGALYQVYVAVGRVTVVSLQPGEELVTVAVSDTVRWIVGDMPSGGGADLRVNVLVKPISTGLKTNLVITTSRRTYLLELTSTEKTWMASVSWEYPRDRVLALQRQAQAASAAAPVDTGLALENLRFRYAISGSNPPRKPLRAFDDGQKVYIQFRRASRKVSCHRYRHRRAGRRATGVLPLPLAVLHRGSAVRRG